MIAALLRAWCRRRHRGEFLAAALVGHGAWTCLRCGSGFVDLFDAGGLFLDPFDTRISSSHLVQIERALPPEATFAAGAYRVMKKGTVVKVGRFRGAA